MIDRRELYHKDKRYKLYMAGALQDLRTLEYIKYFIKENQLQDNFVFEGWKDHYDEKYLFNTLGEAVKMIESEEYNSEEYRRYIEEKFSLDKELGEIKKIIQSYQ